MRRFPAYLLALLALVAVGPACIAAVPHADPEVMAAGRRVYPDYTADELEADRELFLARCTGCHLLAPGKDKSADEWPETLAAMREEVGYGEVTEARLLRYLQVSRLFWEAERERIRVKREERRQR
jgi:hypothetical protein